MDKALAMQAKNTSRIPASSGSKVMDVDSWPLVEVDGGRMLKSLGGRYGTESRLANVRGAISGKTRRNKAIT